MSELLKDFVAVKQASFTAQYEPIWQEFDELLRLDPLGNDKGLRQKDDLDDAQKYRLAELYRQICQHYALACQRHYSPLLIANLHKRVMAGHIRIHQQKKGYASRFLWFVLYEFPNAVRTHYKLFWLSFTLFYLPCLVFGLACYFNNELIYSIMSSQEVARMMEMYDPSNEHFGRESGRESDTDVMMFGYYVFNNVGIDFRVYASGLLFGIGTLYITVYNGVVIGAVSGHLTGVGFGSTFWQFVLGHGSFELMGVVVACMAGLRLATPLIAPAPYTRKDAFRVAGKESVVLILGASLMTFVAAFFEAFWSSSSLIPPMVKYIVATALWVFVAWYLAFCGKGEYNAS